MGVKVLLTTLSTNSTLVLKIRIFLHKMYQLKLTIGNFYVYLSRGRSNTMIL
jgi:hypothetical protein